MRASFACASLLLLACSGAPPPEPQPQPPPPTPAAVQAPTDGRVRIDLCWANDALYARGAPANVALMRALRPVAEALDLTVSDVMAGPCATYRYPELVGCYGEPGVLACRIDDLGKLAASAGFYAALLRDHAQVAADRRARTGSYAPVDAVFGAVQLRSSGTGPEMQAQQLSWMADDLGVSERDVEGVLREGEAYRTRVGAETADQVANDAMRVMLTFLLGHESYHARGDACVDGGKARVEDSELFDFAVAATTNQRLFCRQPAATDELLGDRCGLRALRYRVGSEPARESLVVAADVLGWALTSRFGLSVTVRSSWFVHRLSGYMHPILRSALVGDEILGMASTGRRALCDRSARNAVIAIQHEQTECETQGEVDDPLLARLPRAVEVGWAQGQWSDPESFWCRGSTP